MALTSLSVPGQHQVLCTGDAISTRPAMEYDDDGNKTKVQKRDDQGKLLFSLRGALPLIDGEVVADGSIHLAQEIDSAKVRPGQIFGIEQGIFTVRAARGFGLTGTLRGLRLAKNGGGEK